MALRNLRALELPAEDVEFIVQPKALARYQPQLRADDGDKVENVVDIFGVIADSWMADTTPRQVRNRLREIGDGDVIVNVNSPGGDFFAGVAIYNMLRMHPGKVGVRVLGLAASAASLLAMAGDEIKIPKAAWLMMHNTWAIAGGDRHVMAEVAARQEKFDAVLAQLYADRSGMDVKAIAKMLDATTFLSGSEAVEKGFADSILEPAKVKAAGGAKTTARNRIDNLLSRAGASRAERRELFNELFAEGMPSAADGESNGKPGAADPPPSVDAARFNALAESLASIKAIAK